MYPFEDGFDSLRKRAKNIDELVSIDIAEQEAEQETAEACEIRSRLWKSESEDR